MTLLQVVYKEYIMIKEALFFTLSNHSILCQSIVITKGSPFRIRFLRLMVNMLSDSFVVYPPIPRVLLPIPTI